MDRTVSWFWPRAASMVYEEPKKLVSAGSGHLAGPSRANGEAPYTRSPTRDAQRCETGWTHPPRGMRMEFEAMLKVAFADAGDVNQLRRRSGKSGQTPRRDSLKSSTDQHNTQPQADHFQADCQSLRSPASCSWASIRLLSGGPNGPKTRSVNGAVSRRQLVRRAALRLHFRVALIGAEPGADLTMARGDKSGCRAAQAWCPTGLEPSAPMLRQRFLQSLATTHPQ